MAASVPISRLKDVPDVAQGAPTDGWVLTWVASTSKWTPLAIGQGQIANLAGDLAAKAPIASPTFTGVPAAPTAGAGTNTTQLATTAFVASGLAPKADDSAVVKLTGTQTVAGAKTFSSSLTTAGTLFIGNGSDYIVQNGTGVLQTSATLRVGGQIVTNQSQTASTALAIHRIRPSVGQAGPLTAWEDGAGAALAFVSPAGTPTFVGSLTCQAATSTDSVQPQGRITPAWADSTHATRKGRVSLLASDSTGTDREGLRVESDGTQALLSFGGGTLFKKLLSVAATLDFGSTAAQTSADLTISVTGAAVGDGVFLSLPAAPAANTSFTAWVSAADTVSVRFNNYSSVSVDPASGSYRAWVFKP